MPGRGWTRLCSPRHRRPRRKSASSSRPFDAASLRRESYKRYISQLQVADGRQQNTEQLKASLLTQDLMYLKRLQETINQKLAQVNFEIGQEMYKIFVRDKAEVPKSPATNRRLVYMPVASSGIFFLILGVFLAREIGVSRRDEPGATH